MTDRFYFAIHQGTAFHREFPPFLDAETGERFDFTNDPEGNWTARMEVVDAAGNLVVAFATSGEDGDITLGADGVVELDLASEHTAALESTSVFGGATGKVLFASLVLTDPASGEPWQWFSGTVQITQEVTGS